MKIFPRKTPKGFAGIWSYKPRHTPSTSRLIEGARSMAETGPEGMDVKKKKKKKYLKESHEGKIWLPSLYIPFAYCYLARSACWMERKIIVYYLSCTRSASLICIFLIISQTNGISSSIWQNHYNIRMLSWQMSTKVVLRECWSVWERCLRMVWSGI